MPSAPALLHPGDEARLTLSVPHFSWQPVLAPKIEAMPSHAIQVARDAGFKKILDEDLIAATINWYVPDRELARGTYWWRVAGVSAEGRSGKWSAPRSFTLRSPERVYTIKENASFAEIQKTFEQASGSTPAIVRFTKGEYRLNPGTNRNFIRLAGAKDLTLDGNGATILMHRPVGWIDLENCRRVLIKNLTFQFEPPAYTAGRVVTVNTNAAFMEAEILSGHALPGDWPVYDRDRKGMLVTESEGFAIKRKAPLVVPHEGFAQLEGRRFRFKLANPRMATLFGVGDIYVLGPRWLSEGGGHGAVTKGGEDVVFLGLTLRGAANECLGSFYSDRHAILNVRLERSPGASLSVNNGGNNHHNARTGPWIEGCLFENCGDDACHINGYLMSAKEQSATNRVLIDLKQAYDQFGEKAQLDTRPGDRLIFLNGATGRVLTEARAVSSRVLGNALEVTLDRSVQGLKTGRIMPHKNFDYAVSGNPEVTEIYNASRMCNQFVFRHNVVRNSRRVGVLAKGMGGLIEHNTFDSLGGGGVEFWNAPFEGLGAEDYVVWHNRILNCGRLTRHHAGIWATLFPGGGDRLHRNLLISSNEITGFDGPAILLSDVESALVQNNVTVRRGRLTVQGAGVAGWQGETTIFSIPDFPATPHLE